MAAIETAAPTDTKGAGKDPLRAYVFTHASELGLDCPSHANGATGGQTRDRVQHSVVFFSYANPTGPHIAAPERRSC
jgi:hypothetical protein